MDELKKRMSRTNSPRHHHIDPKAHLKCFADEAGKVYVLRKQERSDGPPLLNTIPHKMKIEKLCAKRDFYTVSAIGSIKDPFFVERRLSKLEGGYFSIANAVVDREPRLRNMSPGQIVFDCGTKKEIMELVYLQMHRGNAVRKFAFEKAGLAYEKQTEMLANFLSLLFGELPSNIRRSLDRHKDALINNATKFITIAPPDDSDLFNMLMGRRCELIINDTNIPFVASDEPVVVTTLNLSEYGLFHVGLLRQDSCVIYPLSPKLLIVVRPCRGILSRYEGVLLGRRMASPDDVNIVNRLNFLQLLSCSMHVVSKDKEALGRLARMWVDRRRH